MIRKYKWEIIYSVFLSGFTIFLLLDTFVIPKVEVVVEGNSSNDSSKQENAIITDTSYSNSNISIQINTKRAYNTNIYVVDITISEIAYLKTAFAQNKYGRNITDTTSSIASSNNAILAINGDYYGFRNSGFVVRNSVIYRSSSRGSNSQDLVIYNDGSFEIVQEENAILSDIVNKGALQVFSFGPALLIDHNLTVDETTEVGMAKSSNPRTAIGIIDKNHFVIIVSDGRTTESKGLSLYELALQFKELGCDIAYNLDGGGSSTLWFNGTVVNHPTDGNSMKERKVSDIVYIGY